MGSPRRSNASITSFLDCTTPEPSHADLAFCFGGELVDPAVIAAGLFRRGVVPLVVVSGGINRLTGEHEATQFHRTLREGGVPEDAMIIEPKAQSTIENIQFALPLITQRVPLQDIRSIIGITKWYHTRRALMTVKRWWPHGILLGALSFDPPAIRKGDWWEDPKALKRVTTEYWKNHQYREKELIAEIRREGEWYV